MKLGSHNSFTYLKPKKWWMRIFTIFARCQSKNIFEQYNAGARYFDLRFRFKSYENTYKDIVVAHGLMEYDIHFIDIYGILNRLNRIAQIDNTKIYIRLLYELPYKDKSKYNYLKETKFVNLCYYFSNIFENLIFCGGQRKYDWKPLAFLEPHPKSVDLYSSQTWKIWDDWYPWIYATIMNNKNYKKYKDKEPKDGFMLMDFVNNIKGS